MILPWEICVSFYGMQKSAEAVVVLIAMETWKEQRAEHK
jgi:hypothetical protein